MIRVTIEKLGVLRNEAGERSGVAARRLEIERRSPGPQTLEEARSLGRDEVATYIATLKNGERVRDVVEFQHRYGDDLLTLVSEAIDALGGRGDAMELRR